MALYHQEPMYYELWVNSNSLGPTGSCRQPDGSIVDTEVFAAATTNPIRTRISCWPDTTGLLLRCPCRWIREPAHQQNRFPAGWHQLSDTAWTRRLEQITCYRDGVSRQKLKELFKSPRTARGDIIWYWYEKRKPRPQKQSREQKKILRNTVLHDGHQSTDLPTAHTRFLDRTGRA